MLETMRKHTAASLERLGVNSLDLTQLHCLPTEVLRAGEVFDHLRTLRDEGLIRRFGASVESMEEGMLCLEQEGLSSMQIIFNVFRQKPIEEFLPAAAERNVAVIVRLPLASGLLAGTMTKDTAFPENDHRNFSRDGQLFNVGETFAGLPFETGVDLAEALKEMLPEGMTLAQMTQRWILDQPGVTTVITGSSNPKHIAENAAVSELPPLPDDLHQALAAFYRTEVARHIRGPY